jgi:hypothetical protein
VATEIASLGKQILNAGVDDCDIFSLLDLLQGGIGADRISDITAAIIYGNVPPSDARIDVNPPGRAIFRYREGVAAGS